MIREGVLAGADAPEAIFGLHVWPEDSGLLLYRAGGFMAAADDLAITVTGRQTPGSSPWLGVDPIYAAAQVVTALQGMLGRQLDSTRGPAVISIGRIRGGVRGNIIPDEVELTGTIRTFDPALRTALHTRLRDVVRDTAAANGAGATVTISESAPVTSNDPALLQRMLPALRRAAGAAQVREALPITAAEDFGYYEQHIPGLYLLLGVGDPAVPRADRPSNHSPAFDVQEEALMVGVRVLVALALDYARAANPQ